MKIALENNRSIPEKDKIFDLNNRAKALIAEKGKEAVINGTIGALLDDDGNLVVMSSVLDEIYNLKAIDFAEYAPIGGIAEYKEAVVKAVFGDFLPTINYEVIATPGGTGAIKNTVANYLAYGDEALTSDWYWAPYKSICEEQGRKLATYTLFDEGGNFNFVAFEQELANISNRQKNLLVLLNTPAHNPTGYALDLPQWEQFIKILNSKKFKDNNIVLFIDVAYIDFAGDSRQVREFLPLLECCNENILSVIGYSASKTFTLYGMRTGAMIGLHKDKEIIDEFRKVCEFSSRNSWSNCNRSGQKVIANIYSDEDSIAKVEEERKVFRDMLLKRGRVFEEYAREKGIEMVPFLSGFFICFHHQQPQLLSDKLAERGIFAVPLEKGIRISVASINEKECRRVVDEVAQILKA